VNIDMMMDDGLISSHQHLSLEPPLSAAAATAATTRAL
jgi:hypothetical protein